MRDIHRAGRPAKNLDTEEATALLKEYATSTTRQLAKKYNVSQSTICNRLRKARIQVGGGTICQNNRT